MPEYFFNPEEIPALPVIGSDRLYPVSRIFCVGRNYVDHAKEMGSQVDKDEPTIFTKPANSIVRSGSTIPYPAGTEDLHYEMELVVAIGSDLFQADAHTASQAVFGFACGVDFTRRDLQAKAKKKANPWDMGKAFENSAVISAINRNVSINDMDDKVIQLSQNEELRQKAHLGDMVWRIEEVLEFLSHYYHLQAGDIIFTGTPAGVGATIKGDKLTGSITDIGTIEVSINT